MTDGPVPTTPSFEDDLEASRDVERRLVPKEALALLVVGAIVVVRQLWLG